MLTFSLIVIAFGLGMALGGWITEDDFRAQGRLRD